MIPEIDSSSGAGVPSKWIRWVRVRKQYLDPLDEGGQRRFEIPALEELGADISPIFGLHDVWMEHGCLPLHDRSLIGIILGHDYLHPVDVPRHDPPGFPDRTRDP